MPSPLQEILNAETLEQALRKTIKLTPDLNMEDLGKRIAQHYQTEYKERTIYEWAKGRNISKILPPILASITQLNREYELGLTDIHFKKLIMLAEKTIPTDKQKMSNKVLEAHTFSAAITIFQRRKNNHVTFNDMAKAYNHVASTSDNPVTGKDIEQWKKHGAPKEEAKNIGLSLREALHEKASLWLKEDAVNHISDLIETQDQERQSENVAPQVS